MRPYSPADVERLRGSIHIEHTLAHVGSERLWNLLHSEPFVAALGAMTGNQAVQQISAGLQAIYVSGWQVAADANEASETYPDQSLYPANSVPHLVRAASIGHFCAPTKSITRMDTTRTTPIARSPTGSRHSSPTRKPDSAAT